MNPNNSNNNYVNTLSNILSKKTIYNNSRNYIDNLKNLNYKQTSQFNNFLTINNNSNNTLKNQRGFHDVKNRLKNKLDFFVVVWYVESLKLFWKTSRYKRKKWSM